MQTQTSTTFGGETHRTAALSCVRHLRLNSRKVRSPGFPIHLTFVCRSLVAIIWRLTYTGLSAAAWISREAHTMANQGKKGSTMRLTLSQWALLLALVMGGCAPKPFMAVLEPRMSEDRCKVSGGVLVGTMCYQG
jgi:hypothetical protein